MTFTDSFRESWCFMMSLPLVSRRSRRYEERGPLNCLEIFPDLRHSARHKSRHDKPPVMTEPPLMHIADIAGARGFAPTCGWGLKLAVLPVFLIIRCFSACSCLAEHLCLLFLLQQGLAMWMEDRVGFLRILLRRKGRGTWEYQSVG